MVSTWWPVSKFPFLVYLRYSGARIICKHTNIFGMQAKLVVTLGNTWPKKVWRHEPTGSRLSFLAILLQSLTQLLSAASAGFIPTRPAMLGDLGPTCPSVPSSHSLLLPRSPFSSPHTGRPLKP